MLIVFVGKIEHRVCLSTLATSLNDEGHLVHIVLPFFEILLAFPLKHLALSELVVVGIVTAHMFQGTFLETAHIFQGTFYGSAHIFQGTFELIITFIAKSVNF